MELKSFREILLKKAEGDPRLEILVECIGQDRLTSQIFESLQKMARLTAAAARNPNSALDSYAGKMDSSDVNQLRSALGHHVAHYQGALKAHHAATDPAQKTNLRTVADKHLEKIVPLAHLAARAERHSNGVMAADLPPIRPWQANYTGTHVFPTNAPRDASGKVTTQDPVTGRTVGPGVPGKELIGTEGWGGRPTAARPGHDQNKSRGTHDYRYLEMPPHGKHPLLSETNHRGGFPFEDIRVGHPSDVDAGGGHLHLPETPDVSKYTPHAFDEHPIHSIFDTPESKISPEKKAKFAEDLANWKSSPHHQGWLDKEEASENEDLGAHMARGSTKPSHVFQDIPLRDQPEHARGSDPAAAEEAAAPEAQAASPADPQKPQVRPALRRPAAQDLSSPPEGADPALARHWHLFDDATKQSLIKEMAKEKK
jgi:hypothetical protein